MSNDSDSIKDDQEQQIQKLLSNRLHQNQLISGPIRKILYPSLYPGYNPKVLTESQKEAAIINELERLARQIIYLREENVKIFEDCSSLVASLDQRDSQLDESEDLCVQKQQIIEKLEETIKLKNQQLTNEQNQQQSLVELNTKLTKNLNSKKSDLALKIEHLDKAFKEIDSLKISRKELEKDKTVLIKGLNENLQAKEFEKISLDQNVTKKVLENQKLKNDLNLMTSSLNEREMENIQQQQSYDKALNHIQNLKKSIEELELKKSKQIESLTKSLLQLQTQNQSLNIKIEQKELETSKLTSDINLMTSNLNEHNMDKSSLQNTLNQYKNLNDELNTNIEKLNNDFNQANQKILEMQKLDHQQKSKIDSQAQSIQKANQNLQQLNTRIVSITQENSTLQNVCKSKTLENETLQLSLKKQKSKCNLLKNEIDKRSKQMIGFQTKIQLYDQTIIKQDQNVKKQKKERSKLQKSLELKNAQVQQLNHQINQLQSIKTTQYYPRHHQHYNYQLYTPQPSLLNLNTFGNMANSPKNKLHKSSQLKKHQ